MFDNYNRQINYLRISVTDRCNLRCVYCMPEEGVKLLQHNEIVTFEEITNVAFTAVRLGIDKIRITGGEPLVRKGIVSLVEMLADIPGIRDLSMTTNGALLKQHAEPLKSAGLMRVNVSLDTLDPARYRSLTRGGDLHQVLEGIRAAQRVGLTPVKINCVVKNSSTEKDAQMVEEFGKLNGLETRFIHQMNLSDGHFSIVEGGTGGDCSHCNRIRLTASGKLLPCLFSGIEYDIRKMGAEQAIRAAIANKPACGSMNLKGEFYNIGG